MQKKMKNKKTPLANQIGQRILNLLKQEFTPKERMRLHQIYSQIDEELIKLRKAFINGEVKSIDDLQVQRVLSSNSLKSKSKDRDQVERSIESWKEACALVEKWTAEDLPIAFDRIVQLNKIIDIEEKDKNKSLREHNVKSRSQKMPYMPIEYLKQSLLEFENNIINKLNTRNPIEEASLLYNWLVSLHPFSNGNGRTARLVADWHLVRNGYLPLSYPNVHESKVAIILGEREFGAGEACYVVCKGIKNSINILMPKNTHLPS